jgi:hypothetical protein
MRMAFYRCYFLSSSGRIEDAQLIESESDDKAVWAAVELLKGQAIKRPFELWDGARKVFPRTRDQIDIEELKRIFRAAGVVISEHPSKPRH